MTSTLSKTRIDPAEERDGQYAGTLFDSMIGGGSCGTLKLIEGKVPVVSGGRICLLLDRRLTIQ